MEQVQRTSPQVKSHITVIETVNHQVPGQNAIQVQSLFSRPLESDEQVYSRKVRVGERWGRLDSGWVKEAGMLVVSNDLEPLQVQPTEEEKSLRKARVVEVGHKLQSPYQDGSIVPLLIILPGESMRVQPDKYTLAALYLRCRSGDVRCTVNVYPA